MGRVHEDMLVVEKEKAPCDKRCTHASGPSCNCRCGCKNHGTGRLVTVEVTDGKIHITTFDKALAERGEMWRNQKASLEAMMHQVWPSKSRWSYPMEIRSLFDRHAEMYERVLRLKVYKTRALRFMSLMTELENTPIQIVKPN
jgi:mRNA-degrading endonuclease HigB of HigAB toxin-antitoxin module